jgi:hypothetical protein
MAPRNKVSVTVQPTTNRRQTSAERRAAQIASVSNKQAELKQEAADRRAKRASEGAPTTSTPSRTPPTTRRSKSR